MLGASQIHDMQQEAAKKAARERRIPFVVWPGDDLSSFPFPFLGEYVPKGWRPLTHAEAGVRQSDHGIYGGRSGEDVIVFVDSSGFSSDYEPALSAEAFRRLVVTINAKAAEQHLTVGWAIYEVGQFQVNVAAYAKIEKPQ